MQTSLEIGQNKYRRGIDQAKGFLILCVVFGHLIPRPEVMDPLKWFIYSFHMPAFLYISGYLMNEEKFVTNGIQPLLKKYKTLLPPWLIISVLWSFIFQSGIQTLRQGHWKSIIKLFAFLWFAPMVHLWYIPSLIVMITAVWFFMRYRYGFQILFPISFLAAVLIPIFPYRRWIPWPYTLLPGDPRNMTYMIYFLLGYGFRNKGFKWLSTIKTALLLGSILIFPCYIACFWINKGWISREFFLAFNLLFLSSMPLFLSNLSISGKLGQSIQFLGMNSLWIYLVHPFFTMPFLKVRMSIGIQLICHLLFALIISYSIALFCNQISRRKTAWSGRFREVLPIKRET